MHAHSIFYSCFLFAFSRASCSEPTFADAFVVLPEAVVTLTSVRSGDVDASGVLAAAVTALGAFVDVCGCWREAQREGSLNTRGIIETKLLIMREYMGKKE